MPFAIAPSQRSAASSLRPNTISRELTPASGLGGCSRLLAEQHVGGLFLGVREARIKAVKSGREALGIVGIGARYLCVGVHVVGRVHRRYRAGALREERIRGRRVVAHRLREGIPKRHLRLGDAELRLQCPDPLVDGGLGCGGRRGRARWGGSRRRCRRCRGCRGGGRRCRLPGPDQGGQQDRQNNTACKERREHSYSPQRQWPWPPPKPPPPIRASCHPPPPCQPPKPPPCPPPKPP